MNDLISRQVAVDAVKDLGDWHRRPAPVAVINVLLNLPSAQPEIIRCRDCMHCYVDGENVRFNVCELDHNYVQSDDWFCADAERKTDG